MPIRLQCPLGHVWEFAHDGRSTLPLEAGSCPVCGQASEQVSLARGTDPERRTPAAPTSPAAVEPVARGGAIPGYEILGELGRGGMGVVYRARQVSLNRVVALKVPRAGVPATADQLARFRAEAEAVARLRHPHIVPVYDYGEHEGRPFFSMEFVDGGTLAERVADTLLPPRPAARLVATLARAVEHAHRAGLVHRDLKPANVLLTDDGTPKISDFGLAPALGPDGRLPEPGGIEGTPSFMAPEQAAGQADAVGPAADVYALGAILYRLLTARPPFQGEDLFATLEQVRALPPVPPRQLQPAVPRDLEAVCLKCLAKAPPDRYANAAELADDLGRFLAGEPVRARRPPAWERAARWGRRRAGALAVAALVACAAGAALWGAARPGGGTGPVAGAAGERVEYFANAVDRWGVPEGVGPLTDEQVRHRDRSLKFYRRGGRVERVEVVNASGRLTRRGAGGGPIVTAAELTTLERAECRFDYVRDEAGRLTAQEARDARGRLIWRFQYTAPDTGHYTDRFGFPAPRTGSGAAYVTYVRSPEGLDAEVRYRDAADKPARDGQGVYGERRGFDGRGRVTEVAYFDPDGRPMSSAWKVARYTLEHDEQGNGTRFTTRDPDGRPALMSQQFAECRLEYDAWGNLTRLAYFGIDGRPCVRSDGYSAGVIRRDARGDPAALEFFGADGRPCLCGGYARCRMTFDDRGNVKERAYDGPDGRPCRGAEGYHRIIGTYDEDDNLVEAQFFDTDGTPCRAKTGFARKVCTFNADGQPLTTDLYDTDGRRCAAGDGVARWTSEYDDRGREVRRSFFGPDGRPCRSAEGMAGWTYAYDSRGNRYEANYFGTDGRPCEVRGDYCRWVAHFDDAGDQLRLTRYDLAGRETVLTRAAVVKSVEPGSRAGTLGLSPEDILLSYDGRPITGPPDFSAQRRLRPSAELIVRRGREARAFQLPPGTLGIVTESRLVPQ